MTGIVLDDVWKVYPDGTEAVRALSLDIEDKEFIVLVGPSGCGKTTALRMVAGLEAISKGTVSIGDRVVNDVPPKDRDIAMVFQNYALYPHMSVFDNMAFGLKLQKMPEGEDRRARARRRADPRPLRAARPEAEGALGWAAPARGDGPCHRPPPAAFLMDEPLSNLDAKLRVQMRSEIARIQHDLGVTTIYVTHDQIEAMTMGDRVAVLRKGELQQVDTPQTLYEHPVNLFVAGFIGSPAMNLVDATLTSTSDDARSWRSAASASRFPTKCVASRPALRGVRRPQGRARHPARGHGGRIARGGRARRASHHLDRRPARGARVRRCRALHDRRAARR